MAEPPGGYPEGGNTQGRGFPRPSILPEGFDGRDRAGEARGSPGVPRDGILLGVPTIATPRDPLINRGPADQGFPKGTGRGNTLGRGSITPRRSITPSPQRGQGKILLFGTEFILLLCTKTP